VAHPSARGAFYGFLNPGRFCRGVRDEFSGASRAAEKVGGFRAGAHFFVMLLRGDWKRPPPKEKGNPFPRRYFYGRGISSCLQMARTVPSLISRWRGTLAILCNAGLN
jgi:hypothetical protein